MGADALDAGIPYEAVASDAVHPGASSSEDTKSIARNMAHQGVDLLLFAGERHRPRHPRCRRNQHPGAWHPRRRQDLLGRIRPDTSETGALAAGWLANPNRCSDEREVVDIDEDELRQGLATPSLYGTLGFPRTRAGFSRASPAARPPTSMPPARWALRSQPAWSRTGTRSRPGQHHHGHRQRTGFGTDTAGSRRCLQRPADRRRRRRGYAQRDGSRGREPPSSSPRWGNKDSSSGEATSKSTTACCNAAS